MEQQPPNPKNPRKCFKTEDLETASRLYNADKDIIFKISVVLGCKLRAVSGLKNRMAVTSSEGVRYEPYKPNKRGRKKLSDQALLPLQERLLELVAENPQITRDDMMRELNVTDYALRILIKRANISHKRAHGQPLIRNTPQLIQKRRDFAITFLNVPQERRIYLDETGFNLHTQDNYGWVLRNMVPLIPVNPNRGRNCTLVMAVSCFGVEAYRVFPGACNGQILANFVREELNPHFEGRPSFFADG